MKFEYNLQEAVSEECYNDIMAMVEANLAEEHLYDAIEHWKHKYGTSVVKDAVKGVGNTVKGAGVAAGNALLNSDNKVANVIKKVPGINQGLRSLAASNLRKARSDNNATFNKTVDNAIAKHQRQSYLANASANPVQAHAANNAELNRTVGSAYRTKINRGNQALNNYRNIYKHLK